MPGDEVLGQVGLTPALRVPVQVSQCAKGNAVALVSQTLAERLEFCVGAPLAQLLTTDFPEQLGKRLAQGQSQAKVKPPLTLAL